MAVTTKNAIVRVEECKATTLSDDRTRAPSEEENHNETVASLYNDDDACDGLQKSSHLWPLVDTRNFLSLKNLSAMIGLVITFSKGKLRFLGENKEIVTKLKSFGKKYVLYLPFVVVCAPLLAILFLPISVALLLCFMASLPAFALLPAIVFASLPLVWPSLNARTVFSISNGVFFSLCILSVPLFALLAVPVFILGPIILLFILPLLVVVLPALLLITLPLLCFLGFTSGCILVFGYSSAPDVIYNTLSVWGSWISQHKPTILEKFTQYTISVPNKYYASLKKAKKF